MEDEGEEKVFISNHFKNLFRSFANADDLSVQQVLDAVMPRVTEDMNNMLTAEFSLRKR